MYVHSDFQRFVERVVDGVADRAAFVGVAHGDRFDAFFFQFGNEIVARAHAHGEHNGVRRQKGAAFRLLILHGDMIFRDRAKRGVQQKPRAIGLDACHGVVDKLEPRAGRNGLCHLNNGHVVAAFVERFGGFQSCQTAADDGDGFVFEFHFALQNLRRGVDVFQRDAGDAARAYRCAAGGNDDNVRFVRSDAVCRCVDAVFEDDANYLYHFWDAYQDGVSLTGIWDDPDTVDSEEDHIRAGAVRLRTGSPVIIVVYEETNTDIDIVAAKVFEVG